MPKRSKKLFPLTELNDIEALVERANGLAKLHTLGHIQSREGELPLYVVTMGSDHPQAPALGIFGGVHGVERIGSEVVLSYMHSLIEGMYWAPAIREQLRHMRLVFMPIVNPGGMIEYSRCNPNHVDLMRNAPIDADARVPFLAGGQRFSPFIPWYRGKKGGDMEAESQALCHVVEKYLISQPFSMALDCHSGYGIKDHIWFPYAGSRKPFPHLAEIQALKNMFDNTYPNHTYYQIEPQSLSYMTHGDLWDHMHIKSLQDKHKIFIPLTLEMGSWQWIKKNPRQIFRFPSMFNPVLPHRRQRILRRHLVFIDFLLRAVQGYIHWLPSEDEKIILSRKAMHRWYDKK